MKLRCLLLTEILLLVPALFLFAQKKAPVVETSSATASYPFTKGNTEFVLQRNLDFSHLNRFQNDLGEGHVNEFGINIGANHFITNDFALGLQFSGDWTGDHNIYDYTNRRWMGWANFTYGKPIAENFDIYGRLGVGYGVNTIIQKYSGNSTTTKDKDFGLKFEIGTPIHLCHHLYLEPDLCYSYHSIKMDAGKQTRNNFGVGLNLVTYLGCRDMMCDCRHGFPLSRNMYTPGHSYIGYYTHGSLGWDHWKTTYDANPNTTIESDRSHHEFSVDYNYYFLPNLAIGAEFDLGGQSQKNKGSSDKFETNNWIFMPKITGNLPVQNGWNNLFLQFGAGFGTQKDVSKIGNSSTTLKQNIFEICTGVGYNDFFSNNLSITPIIGYDLTTFKNKDTGIKQKSRGFEFQIGMRTLF